MSIPICFSLVRNDTVNMEQTKPIDVYHHGKDVVDFAPFEHKHIGDKVCIISENMGRLNNLKLPNGLVLSLGQIIALAGDFYGVPTQPIIDPSNQTNDDRYRRFIDAYNSLAREPKEKLQPELNKLLAALEHETRNLKSLKDKLWDKITGGKWIWFLPVKHGRMLKLAKTNHDHFLPYVKEAYLTGHKLAMDKAREASDKTNAEEKENLLHEALSLDGFACHFLTDSFSSGHIRYKSLFLLSFCDRYAVLIEFLVVIYVCNGYCSCFGFVNSLFRFLFE